MDDKKLANEHERTCAVIVKKNFSEEFFVDH